MKVGPYDFFSESPLSHLCKHWADSWFIQYVAGRQEPCPVAVGGVITASFLSTWESNSFNFTRNRLQVSRGKEITICMWWTVWWLLNSQLGHLKGYICWGLLGRSYLLYASQREFMNEETKTGILSILSGQDQDSRIMTRRRFRIEKWCLRELVLNAFVWALIFVKALPLSLGVLHIFIWMLEIHDFLIHTKEEESRLTGKSWKHIINWGTVFLILTNLQ